MNKLIKTIHEKLIYLYRDDIIKFFVNTKKNYSNTKIVKSCLWWF